MIGDKRVLAVVPARGGSKGVALKNLRHIAGVPLVGLVGQCVAAVPEIDRAVVSTDHPDIAAAAIEYGLEAPFTRPEEISGDRVGDWDVLSHALREVERQDGEHYDIVVMLQPTAPQRRPEHVSATIGKLVDEDWDAVWTVSETDSKGHPLKQLTVDDEGGALDYSDPNGAEIIARQQLGRVYHRNGVAYAIARQCLIDQGTIKGRRTGALVLEGNFISIDTEWDIDLVEFAMSRAGKGA